MEELTFAELLTKIGTYITIAFTAVLAIMGYMVYRGVHLSSTMAAFIFLGATVSVIVAVLAVVAMRLLPY